jgi:glycosyltransferase involved in cell wall biosynthesis
VRHNENAPLVAPHDVPALAEALAALLRDAPRRARLGAAARQTVVDRFDLRVAAQQLAGLFAQARRGAPVAGRMAGVSAGGVEKGLL